MAPTTDNRSAPTPPYGMRVDYILHLGVAEDGGVLSVEVHRDAATGQLLVRETSVDRYDRMATSAWRATGLSAASDIEAVQAALASQYPDVTEAHDIQQLAFGE